MIMIQIAFVAIATTWLWLQVCGIRVARSAAQAMRPWLYARSFFGCMLLVPWITSPATAWLFPVGLIGFIVCAMGYLVIESRMRDEDNPSNDLLGTYECIGR